MTKSLPAFAIGDIAIRQRNNLYSLNDLHKAAGNEAKQKPSEWLRNQQTQALAAEISKAGIPAFETKRGNGAGIYACRELVIAYAAWINATFHLKVIRVFLGTVQPQRPHNPAIDYDRISPAQAQDLKELVHSVVDAKVQGFGETWNRLHRKFRVNSYLELPATKFDDARDYLLGKLPPEAAALAAPAAPIADAERIKHAFALASEAAAQMQRAVFNTLIDGGDFKHGRVMAALSVGHNGQPTVPWAQAIEPEAMVVSLDDLPTRIENNDVHVSDLQLARIGMAVAAKQGARATSRAQARISA